MRPGWVLLRWAGLLVLALLALWLGERLAGAEERQVPPETRKNQTAAERKAAEQRRIEAERWQESPTPPAFPVGMQGGSAMPAGASPAGGSYDQGWRYHY